MPARESAGFLHDDTPYLQVGNGPPLVMVQGLTPGHDVPTGWVHIFPGWGHTRASTSTATTHLTLGFMLAGIPIRDAH